MTTIIKTVAATSCLFFVVGTAAPASELSVEAEGFRPYTYPDLGRTPDEPRVIELRLER